MVFYGASSFSQQNMCFLVHFYTPFSDMFRERYENAALKIDREAEFMEIVFGNLFKFAM